MEECVMNLRKQLFRTTVVILFFAIFAAYTNAQYRAGLQGTVTDSQGAAVSGATVTLNSKDTNIPAKATTNDNGVYTINALDPGHYSLTVEKDGFQKKAYDDLQIAAEQMNSFDVELEVGQITQTVTVSGSV